MTNLSGLFHLQNICINLPPEQAMDMLSLFLNMESFSDTKKPYCPCFLNSYLVVLL